MGKKHVGFDIWWPERPESWGVLRRYLMPHPGTLIITLLLVSGLLWAGSVGAIPLRAPAAATTSTGTIAYQGRLADSAGTPITDTVNMEFRLYDVAAGGTPLWSELWTGSNAVRVSDGLFNVMLGSLEPIPQDVVAGHDQLYLGITVGTDNEMSPRVQLGRVPFAVEALTIPNGSVTTAKIVDGAVTQAKLDGNIHLTPPDGSVTTAKLADGAVTREKLSAPLSLPDNTTVQGSLQTQDIVVHGYKLRLDTSGDDNPHVTTIALRNNDSISFDDWDQPGLFSLNVDDGNGNGKLKVGTLIQGALVEANLQTPEELASNRIDRFEQGDVLCWINRGLVKCSSGDDSRVVAVADGTGKPIVLGAEPIKVLGPVQAGDLLVASDVPGYAIVNNQPAPGTVIAKALEDFAGQRGTIKAMIRTP